MQFTVEENGKKQTVIIPDTGDKSYNEALKEAYTEKTKDQLRKENKPVSKLSPSEKTEAVKELIAFKKRKISGTKKFY
jgi:hypothetical protein